MASDDICPTCETNPVRAGGECGTCHEYRRRNGRARPAHLARRQPDLNRRRFEDRLARRGR
jgi:hypothetical protein